MNGSQSYLDSFGGDSNMAGNPATVKRLQDLLGGVSGGANNAAEVLANIQKGANGMIEAARCVGITTVMRSFAIS